MTDSGHRNRIGKIGELSEQLRFLQKSNEDPISEKDQHGWNAAIIEKKKSQNNPSDGIKRLMPHHPQSFTDETQTQSEHDSPDDGFGRYLLDPGDRSGHTHEKPEETRENARSPDHSRRDRPGMGDGHPSDRLHGLYRNRCPEIEAHKDLEDAEGDENPKRIHLIEGDITDNKRDQGTEIAKGSGKLHLVVVIAPQPHRHSICQHDTARRGLI